MIYFGRYRNFATEMKKLQNTSMFKRIVGTAICFIMSFSVFAQEEEIRIRFLNQYEEPLNSITITNAGKTTDYFADENGFFTIKVMPADSITVSHSGYNNVSYAASSLKTKQAVTLRKEFSWKDLMNPMFYIINGGLWLLLFIVFAETGLFVGFFLPGDSLQDYVMQNLHQ